MYKLKLFQNFTIGVTKRWLLFRNQFTFTPDSLIYTK